MIVLIPLNCAHNHCMGDFAASRKSLAKGHMTLSWVTHAPTDYVAQPCSAASGVPMHMCRGGEPENSTSGDALIETSSRLVMPSHLEYGFRLPRLDALLWNAQ